MVGCAPFRNRVQRSIRRSLDPASDLVNRLLFHADEAMPVLARAFVTCRIRPPVHHHQLLDRRVAQPLDDVGDFARLTVLAGVFGMVIDQHRQGDGLEVLARNRTRRGIAHHTGGQHQPP